MLRQPDGVLRGLAVVVLPGLLVGCGDDSQRLPSRPPSTTAAVATCHGDELVTADTNDDGVQDVIAVEWVAPGTTNRLWVCLAGGASLSAESPAAETWTVADLGGGPGVEIGVGITGMRGANLFMFAVREGRLAPILKSDGRQFAFEQGLADDPSGSATKFTWGCEGSRGRTRFFQTSIGDSARTKTVFELDGFNATVVSASDDVPISAADTPPGQGCGGLVRDSDGST